MCTESEWYIQSLLGAAGGGIYMVCRGWLGVFTWFVGGGIYTVCSRGIYKVCRQYVHSL